MRGLRASGRGPRLEWKRRRRIAENGGARNFGWSWGKRMPRKKEEAKKRRSPEAGGAEKREKRGSEEAKGSRLFEGSGSAVEAAGLAIG